MLLIQPCKLHSVYYPIHFNISVVIFWMQKASDYCKHQSLYEHICDRRQYNAVVACILLGH